MHYGTCPECKKGAKFELSDNDLKDFEKEEKKKQEKRNALALFNVIKANPDTGVIHIDCVALSNLIMNNCGMYFNTIEDVDTGKQEIYFYENGYYHMGGDNRIKEIVQYYLDSYSSIHRKNEVVDHIQHVKHSKRKDLEPPLNLINVKNGVYDINKNELLPHSPDYYFLQQLPVKYDKKADCPKIKAFFKQVVYPKYVNVIQEMFGYILYRKYFIHKVFLLYGGGRNGKGTTINLIAKFIGNENYATCKLQELIDRNFLKSTLYGKLANLGAEVSGKSLTDTSDLKNLSGGEPITGERKFHGAFSFTNYAKLIFNANSIPRSTYDDSTAFFHRWIIVVFPETFEMGDVKTNPNILDELTTDEELSGLLNWAIEGLKRLIKNGKLSYEEDDDEEEFGERYQLLARPDMRFIKESLKLEDGSNLITDDVYDVYSKWAVKRCYPVLTKNSFSRSMIKYMYKKDNPLKCKVFKTRVNNKYASYYRNVSWKDDKNDDKSIKSLDVFDDKTVKMPLNDKLRELKERVKKDSEAGYVVDLDYLYANFNQEFVNQVIQSGLLSKKPSGEYIWA